MVTLYIAGFIIQTFYVLPMDFISVLFFCGSHSKQRLFTYSEFITFYSCEAVLFTVT